MIARVEALNYCCLRYVSQEVMPFNVLVGPNGSGKSTFFDVLALLRDFLRGGAEAATLLGPDPRTPRGRASRVEELFFRGRGEQFELAVELDIPERLRGRTRNGQFDRARYEVAIGVSQNTRELVVAAETFWLKSRSVRRKREDGTLFPLEPPAPATLLTAPGPKHSPPGWRKVVNKLPESGNDYFRSETTNFNMPFKSGPLRSSLANLPEDPDRFPVALWARELLVSGVHKLALNVSALRRPCSPSLPTTFSPDGSNLARVVAQLKESDSRAFDAWLSHVRVVLRDVTNIEVVARPEDNHLYLRVHHKDGDAIPSWLLSDGTLRLFVLTLLPYLGAGDRVYLIEEPENGVHPTAIEAIYDALSAVFGSQVLLATHSPLVLGRAEPRDLLCFTRSDEGAAVVVRGDEHPRLADWRGEVDLPTLYAAGVLS